MKQSDFNNHINRNNKMFNKKIPEQSKIKVDPVPDYVKRSLLISQEVFKRYLKKLESE